MPSNAWVAQSTAEGKPRLCTAQLQPRQAVRPPQLPGLLEVQRVHLVVLYSALLKFKQQLPCQNSWPTSCIFSAEYLLAPTALIF